MSTNILPRALLSIQVLGVVVVLFGDIGFAAPGRFGLDIGHFLIIAVAEVVILIFLALYSISRKDWWPAVWSLIVVSGGLALVMTFL